MNRRDRRAEKRARAQLVATNERAAGFTARAAFDEWKAAHGLDGADAYEIAVLTLDDPNDWASLEDLLTRANARASTAALLLDQDRREHFVLCVQSEANQLGAKFFADVMAWCGAKVGPAPALVAAG